MKWLLVVTALAVVRANDPPTPISTDPATTSTTTSTSAYTPPTKEELEALIVAKQTAEFMELARGLMDDELIATKTITYGTYTVKLQQNCEMLEPKPKPPTEPTLYECYEAMQDAKFTAETLVALSTAKLIKPADFKTQFADCALNYIPSVTTFIYRICFRDDIDAFYVQFYQQMTTKLTNNGYAIAADGTITAPASETDPDARDLLFGGSVFDGADGSS